MKRQATPARRSMGYDYQAVLANLRGEIARRGLTQQGVAHMCGISQPAFSRRMNGGPMTVAELLHICNVLGIAFEDLLRPVEMEAAPGPRTEGRTVAGAGFEPATSGLRAQPPAEPVWTGCATQADYDLGGPE